MIFPPTTKRQNNPNFAEIESSLVRSKSGRVTLPFLQLAPSFSIHSVLRGITQRMEHSTHTLGESERDVTGLLPIEDRFLRSGSFSHTLARCSKCDSCEQLAKNRRREREGYVFVVCRTDSIQWRRQEREIEHGFFLTQP